MPSILVSMNLLQRYKENMEARVGESMMNAAHSLLRRSIKARSFTASSSHEFKYLRMGKLGAKTVVLIHGFNDLPESFLLSTKIYKNEFDIILPYLPGFWGHGLDSDQTYSTEYYTDYIAELLDYLGVQEAHVVGNSLGGAVALMLAHQRPDLVDSLVPLNSAGAEVQGVHSLYDEVKSGGNLFKIRRHQDLSKLFSRIFHRPPPLVSPVRSYFLKSYRESSKQLEKVLNDLFSEGSVHEERGAIVPLGEIQARTMIAWGEKDSLFPLEHAMKLHEEIPDSRIHLFKNTGHCPHIESPFKLGKALRDFWSQEDQSVF